MRNTSLLLHLVSYKEFYEFGELRVLQQFLQELSQNCPKFAKSIPRENYGETSIIWTPGISEQFPQELQGSAVDSFDYIYSFICFSAPLTYILTAVWLSCRTISLTRF